MPSLRILALTALAMIAFAGNSLLCRLALKETHIDAASFTTLRLVSGALVLWLLSLRKPEIDTSTVGDKRRRDWISAVALFAYAAAFSFAYLSMNAATGALLLFAAVQVTMIGHALWTGERFTRMQFAGTTIAVTGLAVLLLPGATTPPPVAAILMLGAGVAWGIYSLRGIGQTDPTRVTAENFMLAAPLALALSAILREHISLDLVGAASAILSGAVASGIGYAVWYAALPALKASTAATVQLSVPVITAAGGVLFLGEALDLRMVVASAAILGGIGVVLMKRNS
ncbi:DMT family transporter [Microbulbifer yueqingensis]|uniref:Threonine/homoserine efflux transporter RhtA n=1 Tax=Microbulbifer yueqingensis TaxID=658219 RepID=A0A1G8ZA42_9GAMM|nr:DMT family transporter [Microbulbifer yueqingensis]SDK11050.1 Threonine/homoserine efflux transporter RhtA [Microbulbifer yueqingensis]